MRLVAKNPHGLSVRWYADHMIDLNKYLAVFPGAKANDFCVWWVKWNSVKQHAQQLEQGFDCESITFKASVNMFERME